MGFVDQFRENQSGAPIEITLIDDESYDVRNRLSLIGYNGIIGFILIAIVLFIFLDFKSGVWVAMGIPFTLAFTLIACLLIGYTVNNITLAAIIIVLGIVVDDAIIVAENISRLRSQGLPLKQAAVEGTHSVFNPIIASILTTCAAFVPLYYFSGRFGMMIEFIPAIVFLMLGASLLESTFLLPAHLAHPLPTIRPLQRLSQRIFRRRRSGSGERHEHWFFPVERRYSLIRPRGPTWPSWSAGWSICF